MGSAQKSTGPARVIRAVALDYGGVLDDRSRPRDDAGNHPVDASCIEPLLELAALGLVLIVSTNTEPGQHRRAALRDAGIDGLFRVVLASDCLGVRKPHPAFFAMAAAAAGCAPESVLHVGDRIEPDILGPVRCGMQTALLRPDGLTERERAQVPRCMWIIRHVRELPGLVASRAEGGSRGDG